MEYTIKSRKLGKTVTFFAPSNGGYIFVDLNGKKGTLGDQICTGGKLFGSTLACKDEADFIKTCRQWWRQYLKRGI